MERRFIYDEIEKWRPTMVDPSSHYDAIYGIWTSDAMDTMFQKNRREKAALIQFDGEDD
jgi:hypothetical protein